MIVQYTEREIWELLEKKAKVNPGPQGFCQFYMDGQFVDQGSNLVVAGGREWVAQRLFNVLPAGCNPGDPCDVREDKVGLFAIGAGGASVNANVVQLEGPKICDANLIQAISLGNSEYLNEPRTYNETDPLLDPYDIYKSVNAVKPIRDGVNGNIELVEIDYGICAWNTKIKCTCVVPGTEPGGLDPGATVPVSEAGLYYATLLDESPAIGYEDWDNSEAAKMFAHITFHPKWKEKESEFRIIWYIII